MKMVALKARSAKGKQRLQRAEQDMLGDLWAVEDLKMVVSFSDEQGPWLKVSPVAADGKAYVHTRWVHEYNDVDFKVEGYDGTENNR